MEIIPGGEWVAVQFQMDNYVVEPTPLRPHVIAWLDTVSGLILGSKVVEKPTPQAVVESLLETMAHPQADVPHGPASIKVADAAAASAIRAALPDVTVTVGKAAQADEVAASFREHMARQSRAKDKKPAPYVRGPVPEDLMAQCFEAAAALYPLTPWAALSADEPVGVDCEELGLAGAVLCTIGQLGQSFGWVLYRDPLVFAQFVAADGYDEQRSRARSVVALNYERGADIPSELRKEASKQAWRVASPHAYPLMMALDEDGLPMPETAENTEVAAALCQALVGLLGESGEALRSGEQASYQGVFPQLPHKPRVRLQVPHPQVEELTGAAYHSVRAPDPAKWLAASEDGRLEWVLLHHQTSGDPEPDSGWSAHAALHVAIETQLATNQPGTRDALRRLTHGGLDRHSALHALATALGMHMNAVVRTGVPFDVGAYEKDLAALTPESVRAAFREHEADEARRARNARRKKDQKHKKKWR